MPFCGFFLNICLLFQFPLSFYGLALDTHLQQPSGVCCPCSQSLQAPGCGFQAVLGAPSFFPGLSLLSPDLSAPSSQKTRVQICCSDGNEHKASYFLWNSAGDSEEGDDQVEQLWMWWPRVCCLVSQWIWKQITHLTWVRIFAFLYLSLSFPHSFPDCFNACCLSFTSFTFSSIPSPFLRFFSSSSNSLTTSCYFSASCVRPLLFTFSLSHRVPRKDLLLQWNRDLVLL